MLIRPKIFPKSIKDACVTCFLFFIIPVIYYFEIFVVIPRYCEQWSFWFNIHFLIAGVILFNICSNLVAIILCDTSIRGRILHTDWTPDWRYCSVCESVAPPRSWHCDVCDICILKRDHHCLFTGCCIGLENHRYFFVFVFYIFIATVYASYYNISFVLDYMPLDSWVSLVKLVFPLAALFMEWSKAQLFLFLIIIVLLGGLFTGALLCFHVNLMLKGKVTFERRKRSKYDRGKLENMKVVLGERWYLVWVSPWIESKLPCDGIDWSYPLSDKVK